MSETSLIDYALSWEGFNDFTVTGTFRFDEQFDDDGIVTADELSDLKIAFFDPDGDLVQGFDYDFPNPDTSGEFTFSFDTQTQTISDFDLGIDFGAGETGIDFFTFGDIIILANNFQLVDFGGILEAESIIIPVNDDFAHSLLLSGSSISTTGTNVNATGEVGEPDHAENASSDANGFLNSVWWNWTATENGVVVIDTFGSDFDTTLAVYTGSTVSSLTEVASNNDDNISDDFQSAVTFTVIAGQTYQIAVDGDDDSQGEIALNLNLFTFDFNNDQFADSVRLIGASVATTGTNVDFTGEVGEPNHAEVSENDNDALSSAWWTWKAPVDSEVTIDTLGSNFDTTLGVYTGSAVDSLTEVASNDDASDLESAVTFEAVAGQTYRIAVDGLDNETGLINLNIDQDINFTQVGGPDNDNLNGSNANDVIQGNDGNDNINGNGGNDYIEGNAGNDNINGGSLSDFLDGGSGDDNINGNGGEDTILGKDGNDTITGSSSNDYIDGGADDDTIYGNGGMDTLIGGNGNNVIFAGSQADKIITGNGNDTIFANGGGDYIDSGAGLDTIFLGGGNATVVLETGEGYDYINSFQLGATKFKVSSLDDLSFNGTGSVEIFQGSDLLAVVNSQNADTFENNFDAIFMA
ncbi:MAG: calcium-binding protein [Nostocaceae cyanobacterium]|nr:calcium-binding protein [Nostocaceae cyanobacterium]